jgi:uncharacterized protein
MLTLLSPAKALDFVTPPAVTDFTTPALMDETGRLIKTTRNLSQTKLRDLMGISPKLAKLNAERYKELSTELGPDNAKQAVLAYNGQAYVGLDAKSLSADDLAFAQDHVGILSGMYGYLRPLDLIQPHRLEMGTKLKTRRGTSLYEFWGDRITQQVRAHLGDGAVLVNLASAEYFKSVRIKTLAARVVTPVFYDTKAGKSRVVFLFAKIARGLMTRWIVENRVTDVERLREFDVAGYRYRPDLSTDDRWAFERDQPPPPA